MIDMNYKEIEEQDKISGQLDQVYNMTFDIVTSIDAYETKPESKDKITTMIQKLLKNIIDNPDEVKFKKLKLTNKNIEQLMHIPNMYDFFKFLGFNEAVFDDELFLSIEEVNLDLFNLVISYFSLLISAEENSNTFTSDKDAYDINEIPSSDQLQNYQLDQISRNYSNGDSQVEHNTTFMDSLKEARQQRIGDGTSKNTWNNLPKYNKKDPLNPNYIKSLLKETAYVRKANSENVYSNSYISNDDWHNNISSNNSGNNKGRSMNINDIRFKNPDINDIFKSSFVITDEIGKNCLKFTNEFRAKHNMPPLLWDDEIWKISYEHSVNMGLHKVKFGHFGFNERIRKLPYRYNLAAENVYMCQGYSEYNVSAVSISLMI